MITLLEAQRLKDAGASQEGTFAVWVDRLVSREQFTQYHGKWEWFAAYTVSELIAAIQSRWGDSYVGLLYKRNPVHDLAWAANGRMGIPGLGSTLLSALVDLYCKLNEGDQ